MTTLSIVYHAGSGHTAKMAEAAAKGAGSVADVSVRLLAISGNARAARGPGGEALAIRPGLNYQLANP